MLGRSGFVLVVELGEVGVLTAVVANKRHVELVVEVDDGKDDGRESWNLEFNASRGEGVDTPIELRDARRGGYEAPEGQLDRLVEGVGDGLGAQTKFQEEGFEATLQRAEGGLVKLLGGQAVAEVLDGAGVRVEDTYQVGEVLNTRVGGRPRLVKRRLPGVHGDRGDRSGGDGGAVARLRDSSAVTLAVVAAVVLLLLPGGLSGGGGGGLRTGPTGRRGGGSQVVFLVVSHKPAKQG
jgi:hypothetical protein